MSHRESLLPHTPDAHTANELSRLEEIARIARDHEDARVERDAQALQQRLRAGLFHVACVGQFKRGKSTLINALLEDDILPTGVAPVTAIVTIVRHGARREITVHFENGETARIAPENLADFVSEAANPGNSKGVLLVEIQHPSPILSAGMCLVDTPGVGSVFESNTASTRQFVPQMDAALVVLGADPPISGEELALVKDVAAHCGHLVFLLNKADKLAPRDLEEGVSFTRNILEKELGAPVEIFCTSALARKNGRAELDWDALCKRLDQLAHEKGSQLVIEAAQRGVLLMAQRLGRRLEEVLRALTSPLDVTQQRIRELETCVRRAERSLSDLTHLFNAERERILRIVETHKEIFRENDAPAAQKELATEILRLGGKWKLRAKSVEAAQNIARAHLDAWLQEMEPLCERLYVEASARFSTMAEEFLQQLEKSGDPAFAGVARGISPESGFRTQSRLYYAMMIDAVEPSLWERVCTVFRTRAMQQDAVRRQVGAYLQDLMLANLNRIDSDFDERIQESRRRYESEIRSAIQEVLSGAQEGLARAQRCLQDGQAATELEIQKIRKHLARLAEITQAKPESAPTDR